MPQPANILIVGHAGRLQYEALLFVLSLRASAPQFHGRIVVAEPQPGPLWDHDPRMAPDLAQALRDLGAEIRPFDSVHFGQTYLQGNKIEALTTLPAQESFVFFDTDTLITGEIDTVDFDFTRPAASMNRSGTWPVEKLYWPGYTVIWKSLYDKFGLDFASSLDLSQPDEFWQRYLYFNAGWFFGADAARFGQLFTDYAVAIRDDAPPELVLQPLDPWLDQVALPLVIHHLGGGRPGPALAGLDGDLTCHYRLFPLLYARGTDRQIALLETLCAPNPVKKLLKQHVPVKRMVYQGQGAAVRALFDRTALPRREQAIRNRIKTAGYWVR